MMDLKKYKERCPEELLIINRFDQFLKNPHAYDRTHEFGHFTASAFILNADRSSLLMLHHKKLAMWLQPGGHADGEVDLLAVARKEAAEETGLSDLVLLSDGIGDLDIHVVPAFGDMPKHFHFDVRFFFQAQSNELLKNDESHEVKWVPLNQIKNLNQEEGTQRVLQKMQEVYSF
jgi:8-oxo-dGTP pyrophosphatase MutT (NUDIX family)